MAYFEPARIIEEFIGLAWLIEGATQTFYWKMAERFKDTEAEPFFNQMGFIEERHQAFLEALFEKITGKEKDDDFPQSLLPSLPAEPVMEGGIKLKDALEWSEDHDLSEVLQLAISCESNAFDRYLLMIPKMEDEETKDLFRVLAEEEKAHLMHLTSYLERILARS
jgi:rubrerythrin